MSERRGAARTGLRRFGANPPVVSQPEDHAATMHDASSTQPGAASSNAPAPAPTAPPELRPYTGDFDVNTEGAQAREYMMLQDDDAERLVGLRHSAPASAVNDRTAPRRHGSRAPSPPPDSAPLDSPPQTRQEHHTTDVEQPVDGLQSARSSARSLGRGLGASGHDGAPAESTFPRLSAREIQSAAESSVRAASALGEKAASRAANIAAPLAAGAKEGARKVAARPMGSLRPFLSHMPGRRRISRDDDGGGGDDDDYSTGSGFDGGPGGDGNDDGPDGANAFAYNGGQRADEANSGQAGQKTRIVWLNNPTRNNASRFPSNYVSTTKYTPLNALPKFLFEQFTRFSNAYFLFVGILYCIDSVTPIFTVGRYSNLWTLAFVIAISGVKEGIEDVRRYRQDRRVNRASTHLIGGGSKTTVRWADVKVGDLIRVRNKETFPADMVLLASSSEDGLGFVETKQLDGESNLKVKTVPPAIAPLFKSDAQALIVQGRVECETPNDRLYNFHGSLRLTRVPDNGASAASIDVLDSNAEGTLPVFGTPVAGSNVDPFLPTSSAKSHKQSHTGSELGSALAQPEASDDGLDAAPDTGSPRPSEIRARRALRRSLGKLRSGSSFGRSLSPFGSMDSTGSHALSLGSSAPAQSMSPLSSPVPLGPESLAIRGTSLRNTEWVMGLVINTGRDTKLMQNVKPRPRKNSRLERDTNRHFFVSLLLQITIVLACTIRAVQVCRKLFVNGFAWYLITQEECSSSEGGLRFLTFFATFSGLIPISLYVSMEIVRGFQMYFIEKDAHMRDPETGVSAEVRTSNLNEELGVVHHVFTDKTGTLTANRMDFRKVSLAGRVFSWRGEAEPGTTRLHELTDAVHAGPDSSMSRYFEADELKKGDMAMRLLAVCHSVVAEVNEPPPNLTYTPSVSSVDGGGSHAASQDGGRGKQRRWKRRDAVQHAGLDDSANMDVHNAAEDHGAMSAGAHGSIAEVEEIVQDQLLGESGDALGTGSTPDITYQASSPDEAALVAAARAHGFMFVSRSNRELVIQVNGELEEYELLEVLEFDSTRKRMSVITRCPDGKIRLFIKGADSVIFERLAPGQDTSVTAQHLHDFAVEGLRTLCLAYTTLSERFYAKWKLRYVKASTLVNGRDEAVAAVADEVEKKLTLIGATAIEDKLQDGVPETLRKLEQANVKIWVLTGDKQETAINIGLSCGAIDPGMDVYIINENNVEDTSAQIDCAIGRWKALLQDPGMERKLGLVIDGQTLHFALHPVLQKKLMHLARMARSVIACRVSPKQKTEIVELVRRHEKEKITLAIGDGANDVGMIQAAHVGVGIVGLEGQEAKLASDFSIGQFRFLQRLMLVHGRWSYKRLSKMVLFLIYKTMLLTVSELYWAGLTAYSGQPMLDPWMSGVYNVFSSSLPPIVVGIFDQELSAEYALAFPEVYIKGQRNSAFNFRVFVSWIFSALWQSALIFYVTVWTMGGRPQANGQHMGMWAFGTVIFTIVVVVMHVYGLMYLSSWTALTTGIYALSFASWFIIGPVFSTAAISLNSDFAPALFAVTHRVFADPRLWLLVLLLSVLCISPSLLWKYHKRQKRPNVKMLVQELMRAGQTREGVIGETPKPSAPVPDRFNVSAPSSPVSPATFVRKERQYAFSGYNFDGDEGVSLLVRRHAYANSKGVRRRRMRVLKRAGSDTELDVAGVQTVPSGNDSDGSPPPLDLMGGQNSGHATRRRTRFALNDQLFDDVEGQPDRSRPEDTDAGAHVRPSHRRAMSDGAVLVEDIFERLGNQDEEDDGAGDAM